MTRTTIDLDPFVIEQLRRRARRDGKSMGRVASEHLARALAHDAAATPDLPPLALNQRPLGTPLVDLESRDAVWAALDASDA